MYQETGQWTLQVFNACSVIRVNTSADCPLVFELVCRALYLLRIPAADFAKEYNALLLHNYSGATLPRGRYFSTQFSRILLRPRPTVEVSGHECMILNGIPVAVCGKLQLVSPSVVHSNYLQAVLPHIPTFPGTKSSRATWSAPTCSCLIGTFEPGNIGRRRAVAQKRARSLNHSSLFSLGFLARTCMHLEDIKFTRFVFSSAFTVFIGC